MPLCTFTCTCICNTPLPSTWYTLWLTYVCTCACIISQRDRQIQATMPKDNSSFPRRAALGGTWTCNVLRSRQTLYQLSHRGSSAGQAESLKFVQGKWRLSPDKQGYSTSASHVCTRSYSLYYPPTPYNRWSNSMLIAIISQTDIQAPVECTVGDKTCWCPWCWLVQVWVVLVNTWCRWPKHI